MKSIDHVVIRFSGDSGDGMQLTGGQFSSTSALMGNDIATFPDYPAEIRAPQGTVAGVSGFQVHFGSTAIHTPGDRPDVLVAMNPAALKANIAELKDGGVVLLNTDTFTKANLDKVHFDQDPRESGLLDQYQVIEANMTTQTKEALSEIDLDTKSKARCKNFYALGMSYFMYSRDLAPTIKWINDKFAKNPTLSLANVTALKAGYNYAETIEVLARYTISPASIGKGTYRQISGNQALAWGLTHAAQKAGLQLFLGSYPITPASDILHELSKLKNYGVMTFQAEDEIAAVCSAIGASFAGGLGVTTSSGPGIALKSEAINLAVMYELPLVVIDVQRGGPSTGLPTKTEQSDLNLALYGRNGESPLIVLAASSPTDCFDMAYEATRLALEHMSPVILLSDGYIANGSSPWKIPDVDKDYPKLKTRKITAPISEGSPFHPYARDEKLVRPWAELGSAGLEHRVGGLEKADLTGDVSYDPANHQRMVELRAQKVAKVSDSLPLQQVEGDSSGALLIISWGGTFGSVLTAVNTARERGQDVSCIHLKYLNPLPKNLEQIFKSFKRILVAELNAGQLAGLLSAKYRCCEVHQYTKIQGRPFTQDELLGLIDRNLEELGAKK